MLGSLWLGCQCRGVATTREPPAEPALNKVNSAMLHRVQLSGRRTRTSAPWWTK